MSQAVAKPMKFDQSGFYFIGLLIVAFLGFWKSYFSKFFYGVNDQSFYFHFHAAMMISWTAMLIVQPILIRKKKLHLHRLVGKLSYVVMPLLLISVLLILNASLKKMPAEDLRFSNRIFPIRDFLFLSVLYTIAVVNRHRAKVHARAMVATGIVFIEPSLVRFLAGQVFPDGVVGVIITWALILGLLITLIIMDWKQKSGRWIFGSMLVVFIVSYIIRMTGIPIPPLDAVVQWFAKLPLT